MSAAMPDGLNDVLARASKLLPTTVKHAGPLRPARWVWGQWWKWQKRRRQRQAKESFSSMEEFLAYMEATEYHEFIQYHRSDPHNRRQVFACLFDELALPIEGARVLDLGPGYGDSLDLARDRGAASLEFVDSDPRIAVFNNLKGHAGYMIDYMLGDGLAPLAHRRFDIIISKGSINADMLNRREPGVVAFETWMSQVEGMTAAGGHIIICPTWDRGTHQVGDSYYVCRDPEGFPSSPFGTFLANHAYERRVIAGFNDPPERFPFTYYKRLPG